MLLSRDAELLKPPTASLLKPPRLCLCRASPLEALHLPGAPGEQILSSFATKPKYLVLIKAFSDPRWHVCGTQQG